MGRKKSQSNMPPEESSSSWENSGLQTNLELDNRALRVKNANLVKAVAKLQLEKAQFQKQITQLQEDYFKLNSTFVNLKNILSTIDGTIKTWFPKFIEFSEMFTKIMQLCSVGKTVSLNKDPRTQAVQPHAVNGHVLQHPTISLSRFNNISSVSSRRRSNQNSSNQDNPPESIETDTENQNIQAEESERLVGNNSNEENEYDVERIRYSRRRHIPIKPLSLDELQEQEDDEIDDDGDLNNDEEYCSRLYTIREEDGSNFGAREIRVYIDRLPSEYVRQNAPCIRNSITDSSMNSSSEEALMESENREYSGSHIRFSVNNRRRSNPNQKFTSRSEVTCIDGNSRKTNATIIEKTEFRRTMSPLKRREAQYFGEPSSLLQSTNDHMESSIPSFSSLQTDPNLEISNDISAIPDVPSCSIPFADHDSLRGIHNCSIMEHQKKILFQQLCLEPMNPKIATSTPVLYNRKSINSSTDSINSSTPMKKNRTILSKVTMKRGSSSDKKKMAQVVLQRMSFEKRSGSTAKKMSDISNVSIVITKSSQISRRQKKTKKLDSSSSSNSSLDSSNENVKTRKENDSSSSTNSSTTEYNDVKENVDTSNRNNNDRIPKEDTAETSGQSTSRKINRRVLSKGNKRFGPTSSPKKFNLSPRPKRAARPTTLKEPTLNKKMRRSK